MTNAAQPGDSMNMSAPTLPAFGQPLAGGFYAGQFRIGDDVFALIVAQKADGETTLPWNSTAADITGANSYNDGHANTAALADAGSSLGKWATGLSINGFQDWYVPSRDELELMYRNLKPTTRKNYCSFRDGDNPSSIPLGYPYTETSPAQTGDPAFQEGGAEALSAEWHWASTQYAAGSSYAWGQDFDDGYQGSTHRVNELKARAVRRLKI